MGYDGRPIGPDLIIVTVVLRCGVFATQQTAGESLGVGLAPLIPILLGPVYKWDPAFDSSIIKEWG